MISLPRRRYLHLHMPGRISRRGGSFDDFTECGQCDAGCYTSAYRIFDILSQYRQRPKQTHPHKQAEINNITFFHSSSHNKLRLVLASILANNSQSFFAWPMACVASSNTSILLSSGMLTRAWNCSKGTSSGMPMLRKGFMRSS